MEGLKIIKPIACVVRVHRNFTSGDYFLLARLPYMHNANYNSSV